MWLLDVLRTKPRREHLISVVTRDEVVIYAAPFSHQIDEWKLITRQQIDASPPKTVALQTAAEKAFNRIENPCLLTILLDSYWAPISLIKVGRSILSPAEIQALAKHRFKSYFGPTVEQWALQIDYRAGYEHALACGLPRQVLDAVNSIEHKRSHIQLKSITPSLIWALADAQSSSAKLSRHGWVAVAEPDRSLVARIAKGQVVSLHPAAPVLRSTSALPDMVAHGAQNLGELLADEPIAGYCFAPTTDLVGSHAGGTGWSWHACRQTEAA